jgi:putative ABC transport system substrate-binding protein
MSICLRRRDFIAALSSAVAAWPLAARAQQGDRVRRIAILGGVDDTEGRARIAAFRTALDQLGWRDGINIRFDYRWTAGDAERIKTYATEFVNLRPDVIVVAGIPTVAALLQQTRSIPIVMSDGSDPIAAGFASSLARPGGNFTGFINFEYAMAGKWLQTLKEIAPDLVRVAIVHNPENPTWPGQLAALETAAHSVGVQLTLAGVHNAAEIESAIADFAREPNGGLMVLPVVLNSVHRDLIISLAAKYRLPATYPGRSFTAAGGLLSYGIDLSDLYRRAASYADRILRGEKAGDLPIQTPTKFELVINLGTAKRLGLTVPPTLFALATEVIE